jgi:hypothetical protein
MGSQWFFKHTEIPQIFLALNLISRKVKKILYKQKTWQKPDIGKLLTSIKSTASINTCPISEVNRLFS